MVDEPTQRKLKLSDILSIITLLCVIGGVIYESGIKSNAIEQMNLAVVTINSRLDRLFEKVDIVSVLVEKVRSLETQITDARGNNTTLEQRIRLIESNNAANHADIKATNPKLYPQK